MPTITYTTTTDTSKLYDVTRQYCSVIRFAYNRWQDNIDYSLAEIYSLVKTTMVNLNHLDVSLIQMAVDQAKSLRKRKHVIFGSEKEFNKLKFKKSNANKNTYKLARSSTMLLRGDKLKKGNKKAQLDISNNRVIVKISKSNHIVLPVKFSSKQTSDLLKLEELCKNNQAYFSLRINNGSIGISFDLGILSTHVARNIVPGRVLAWDANPNYIGLVVKQSNDILYKEIIDFRILNHKHTPNNKKKYEKSNIAKYLTNLAKHYDCEAIAMEKISLKPKNHANGRAFNRLVNNTWHRKLIEAGIRKHSCLQNIKIIEVIAAYSSQIGCLLNPNEVDSVAAAIEISSRAELALLGIKYKIKPQEFSIEHIPTQWKEMECVIAVASNIKNLSNLIEVLKKAGFSYRFLYTDLKVGISFRHKSYKSHVFRCIY